MKKLTLLMLLVFSLNAFSQVEKPITKGNILLEGGGTIQYSNVTSDLGSKTSIFDISLNPGFAYFIIDHLAIGLNTPISYYEQGNNDYYTLGVGPIVRYYFNNGLFLKTEASYSFLHGLESNIQVNNYFSLKPGIGYAFFINQKVSLEPCLSYEFENTKFKSGSSTMTNKSNNLLVELKFSIFL